MAKPVLEKNFPSPSPFELLVRGSELFFGWVEAINEEIHSLEQQVKSAVTADDVALWCCNLKEKIDSLMTLHHTELYLQFYEGKLQAKARHHMFKAWHTDLFQQLKASSFEE